MPPATELNTFPTTALPTCRTYGAWANSPDLDLVLPLLKKHTVRPTAVILNEPDPE